MTSLLELVSRRQYVQRRQSNKNTMSTLRLLIRRNAALEVLKDIIECPNKLKRSSPHKKLKTNDGPSAVTNTPPNEIPSLVGYVGYYTGHVVKQPADGHCLFHSIIYSLNHTNSTVEQALELRRRLAGYMQEHRSTVISGTLSIEECILTDKDIEDYILDENDKPCFATYIKNLCCGSNIPGGHIEIICLSKMIRISVIVFQGVEINNKSYFGKNDLRSCQIEEATNEIGIIFEPSTRHYDALENYTLADINKIPH
jgi:hypothetical protein